MALDINLFIAAFWNRGSASARVIRACIDGRLKLVYTDETLKGLQIVLRTIRAPKGYVDEVVQRALDAGERVEGKPAPVTCEDREDQAFLECAVGADADYLITSDRHLLKLKQVGRTKILTPTQFWQEVSV
ncbi:MAG: putative toxin-antitoxin system toxin component, PIN family [Armatimonadota bacterium]|nr:putative toxin-antitoxin system toxin component, PIN family [Armatimonadota bacterium]